LLDEPTNDLDIPTLEILEESLLEYRGALVLVTHDRYLLDRISTLVLGLDGLGKVEGFADYTQWDAWRQSRQAKGTPDGPRGSQRSRSSRVASPPAVRKQKLSYGEAREFATIEQRIAAAEQDLHAKRSALEDPAITSDVCRLRRICDEMGEAQKTIDYLYARWAELEKKQD
jgi:ATP-binding cassette subfamily F protein uup